MKLHVFHETSYRYDQPVRRSIQMLRMTPPKTQRQRIVNWHLDMPGKATQWTDAYGNLCHCLVLENASQDIVLRARGTVELSESDQGEPEGVVPHTVYLRPTALTSVDTAIQTFIDPFKATVKSRPYMGLHDVMLALLERMPYETGITHVGDSAAQSFAKGKGVCQDHTHVFLAWHIRLAHGLDYEDASPVRGMRIGGGFETMHSYAKVESVIYDQQ